MARHAFVISAAATLVELVLIFSLGLVGTTAAWAQVVVPENAKRETRGDDLEDFRPKVQLGKIPAIRLGPRGPLTKERADRIRACITGLARLENADSAPSPTLSGRTFLPVPTSRRSGHAMLMTDHRLNSWAALLTLVKIGPDALPFLLGALNDKTPTNLNLEHRYAMGAMWFDNELWGNPANELEMKTLGPRQGIHGAPKRDRYTDSYTVKVGDVCLAVIGQITGRGYQAVRYQPSSNIVINSPTEDANLREQVRKIWTSDDPARKLLESLLLDYSTEGVYRGSSLDSWSLSSELRAQAAMRMLYYYPKETSTVVSERLRGLDVRRTAAHGRGSPSTEEEADAGIRRVVANGVRADDFIKAVSWCREPEVRKAIRAIFTKTTDIDILLAALPGIEDTDRALIRERLQAFLDALPADEQGVYGDGYNLLDALAERLGEDAAPAFDRYLKVANAQRVHSAAEVLVSGLGRGGWCVAILSHLLDDRRPVGGSTYAVRREAQDAQVVIRVCDAAAEAVHRNRPELKFTLEGEYADLDKQIRTMRDELAEKRR